ncbi:unnamed protein product [Schistosoma rodhaini]|nr:uncharacterized protein Smp_201730 [Schistosoma mansoni]CAH8526976.1 unnamed protein product [Schistosoma rodhaini]|eukprot:XP_018649855.1 uncharacterized protein Smp_201730 [Schistosoma mansoni]
MTVMRRIKLIWNNIFIIIVVFICTSSEFWRENNLPCKNLGTFCRKLPFSQRCCDTTVCDLKAPFSGTCVRCLDKGRFCLRSRECCDKYCFFFKCR